MYIQHAHAKVVNTRIILLQQRQLLDYKTMRLKANLVEVVCSKKKEKESVFLRARERERKRERKFVSVCVCNILHADFTAGEEDCVQTLLPRHACT